MKPSRVKDLLELLPDLEELWEVRAALIRASYPDPDRTWAASGELQTAEDRLVDPDGFQRVLTELRKEEHEHRTRVQEQTQTALRQRSLGRSDEAVDALLSAAALEEARGRFRQSGAYASAAHSQALLSRNQRLISLVLRRRARAGRSLGFLDEALDHYAEAHRIAAAVGDHQGVAEAAIGAGNVLEQGGRWREAAGWYQGALAVLSGEDEAMPERWHASLNLHIVHRSLGRVAESAEWLERAESMAHSMDDASAEFFLVHARGQLRMAESRFEAAEQDFLEALSKAPPAHRPMARLNLAESLLARGQGLGAAEEARAAEAEAIIAGRTVILPHVYRTLGRCASTMGNRDSFVLFERALELPGPESANRLERGTTLQEYAVTVMELGLRDEAADLMSRAAQQFRLIGVNHFRRRWADCFDVGSTEMDGREALSCFS